MLLSEQDSVRVSQDRKQERIQSIEPFPSVSESQLMSRQAPEIHEVFVIVEKVVTEIEYVDRVV